MEGIYPQPNRNVTASSTSTETITHVANTPPHSITRTLTILAPSRMRLNQLSARVTLQSCGEQEPPNSPDRFSYSTFNAVTKVNGIALQQTYCGSADIFYFGIQTRTFHSTELVSPLNVEKGEPITVEVTCDIQATVGTTNVLILFISIAGDWMF